MHAKLVGEVRYGHHFLFGFTYVTKYEIGMIIERKPPEHRESFPNLFGVETFAKLFEDPIAG